VQSLFYHLSIRHRMVDQKVPERNSVHTTAVSLIVDVDCRHFLNELCFTFHFCAKISRTFKWRDKNSGWGRSVAWASLEVLPPFRPSTRKRTTTLRWQDFIIGSTASIFDLWSRPWCLARLMRLLEVSPRPQPLQKYESAFSKVSKGGRLYFNRIYRVFC